MFPLLISNGLCHKAKLPFISSSQVSSSSSLMYRFQPPQRYVMRYPRTVLRRPSRISRLDPQEQLWRRQWPRTITILLAVLMLLFTLIIFALEIASLVIDSSSTLSNTASTGAGIWCSIVFLIAILSMCLLVFVYDCSTRWSTCTLVAHLIAVMFICILIGLDANAVTPYNQVTSTAPRKIQVLKGQLALAILMLLFPIGFLAIYIYTAFVSRPPPRTYRSSVRPPLAHSVRAVKY